MASEFHPVFIVSLVIMALSRLIELQVSKSRVKKLDVDEQTKDANYLLMIFVHVLLFVAPVTELILVQRVFSWSLAAPMVGLLTLASVLRLWVIKILGPSWNTRGLIDQEMTIVKAGPYAYIRHPNYLAVCTEFIALPLIQGAWISAVIGTVANALVLAWRIPQEEAQLKQINEWKEHFGGRARILPGIF